MKYQKDILTVIKSIVDKAGSQKAAAKQLGVTQAYLCDILQGRRGISDNVAEKIGYQWVLVKRP